MGCTHEDEVHGSSCVGCMPCSSPHLQAVWSDHGVHKLGLVQDALQLLLLYVTSEGVRVARGGGGPPPCRGWWGATH